MRRESSKSQNRKAGHTHTHSLTHSLTHTHTHTQSLIMLHCDIISDNYEAAAVILEVA